MSTLLKRTVLGCLVIAEVGVVILLCVLIARQLQKQKIAGIYAARLSKDAYNPQVNSDRFPHFFEPAANTIINDDPPWLGTTVSYSINEDSLNERHDYPVTNPPGGLRIITLGDSFTYGLLVNTYENYTELLEDRLIDTCGDTDPYEVINLGVPAYDIGYAAERFRLRGQKYGADLVVWFINPFTFEIDADRKVALENEYIKKIPKADHWKMVNGKPQYYPGSLAWKQIGEETNDEQNVAKQAAYFRDFLGSFHGTLVVVANQWSMWHPDAIRALEAAINERPQTGVYRMDPLEPESELLADGHPNVIGHNRIATNILEYLSNQGILPCR